MAELAIGIGPPAEDATALRDRDGMTPSTGKVQYVFALQGALDEVWSLLPNAAIAVQAPSQLAEVVVAPGVELALLRKSTHVLISRSDLSHLHALETHLTLGFVAVAPGVREEPGEVGGLEAAPTPNITSLGESEAVVASAGNLGDVSLVRKLGVHWQGPVLLVSGAELPEVVLTPREDPTALRQRAGMLLPEGDLADPLPLQCQHGAWCIALWVTPGVRAPEVDDIFWEFARCGAIDHVDEAAVADVATEGILIGDGYASLTSEVNAVN
mmetsp:Transcript_34844/g.76004  ORF Transcript_34844/g.76004 Transcript_34844/m.76004 type:complete len:270 (-) Transcript_34844:379-1188(-)